LNLHLAGVIIASVHIYIHQNLTTAHVGFGYKMYLSFASNGALVQSLERRKLFVYNAGYIEATDKLPRTT